MKEIAEAGPRAQKKQRAKLDSLLYCSYCENALQQGDERGFSGGKNALKLLMNSSFRWSLPRKCLIRGPESRLFTNLLILKQKPLDPGLRRGDVYRVFRPDVRIPILFHHPVMGRRGFAHIRKPWKPDKMTNHRKPLAALEATSCLPLPGAARTRTGTAAFCRSCSGFAVPESVLVPEFL